eukprot:6488167-Amphidinium_carterae.1
MDATEKMDTRTHVPHRRNACHNERDLPRSPSTNGVWTETSHSSWDDFHELVAHVNKFSVSGGTKPPHHLVSALADGSCRHNKIIEVYIATSTSVRSSRTTRVLRRAPPRALPPERKVAARAGAPQA